MRFLTTVTCFTFIFFSARKLLPVQQFRRKSPEICVDIHSSSRGWILISFMTSDLCSTLHLRYLTIRMLPVNLCYFWTSTFFFYLLALPHSSLHLLSSITTGLPALPVGLLVHFETIFGFSEWLAMTFGTDMHERHQNVVKISHCAIL